MDGGRAAATAKHPQGCRGLAHHHNAFPAPRLQLSPAQREVPGPGRAFLGQGASGPGPGLGGQGCWGPAGGVVDMPGVLAGRGDLVAVLGVCSLRPVPGSPGHTWAGSPAPPGVLWRGYRCPHCHTHSHTLPTHNTHAKWGLKNILFLCALSLFFFIDLPSHNFNEGKHELVEENNNYLFCPTRMLTCLASGNLTLVRVFSPKCAEFIRVSFLSEGH